MSERRPAGRSGLDRVRGSPFARNTGWALFAEAARMVTSVGTFLVITYALTPSDYGIYVGTLGLLWFLLPFASVGAGYLLLKRVAGDGVELGEAVARANGMVVGGGLVTVVALIVVRPLLLPQSPALVLALLALSELVFGGMQEIAVFASQAGERLRLSLALRLMQGGSRLVAAVGLVLFHPGADLSDWAWLHLATAAGAAVVGQMFLGARGSSRVPLRRPRFAEARLGLPFSVGFGADKLRESADAVLLLRIGSSTDAGIYGAAIRLIGVANAPLRALIASSNARFFASGAHSVAAAASVARRITALGAAYAVAVGIGVVVAGPVVISVMSDEYASTAAALRLLSVLPLAISLEAFVATAMTAAGHQRIRVLSTLVSTALNVVLNVVLIPDHGWRGAVVASLACSALNATILWSALLLIVRRERTGRAGSSPARR
jgi:O-antigen/teichoic acid export membrane protein